MLSRHHLIPDDFDYIDYAKSCGLASLLKLEAVPCSFSKIVHHPGLSVDPANLSPYPAELDDLCRLHYIATHRKILTILEFGVGCSTIIFADAIRRLSASSDFDPNSLRRDNPYKLHSVDNCNNWLQSVKSNLALESRGSNYVEFHLAHLRVGTFCDRICTYYDPLPNVCPDIIYLDGPDQFSALGSVRGITTAHQDRMPMSADILSIEHFLLPSTLIIVDGRSANARFLRANLQRNWAYYYADDWDQHFFELQEIPLGVYNRRHIDSTLGASFYDRLAHSEHPSQ
jgi:hypothetical protein